MKEKLILFNGPMVRAVLDDRKTKTRRVVKPQPPEWACSYWGIVGTYSGLDEPIHYWQGVHPEYEEEEELLWPSGDKWTDMPQWDRFEGTGLVSPYGSEKNCIKAAGKLWVREAWSTHASFDRYAPSKLTHLRSFHYWADGDAVTGKKRPSTHMPRWASRITLEIVSVCVERLQGISESDALAEGITQLADGYGLPDGSHFHAADPRQSYFSLWESINGVGSVEANPWVWSVEFKRAAQTGGAA